MTTDLTTIQRALSPVAVQANELAITDDPSLKQGVELLSRLNQYNDSMQSEKEKVTKPLNEALKAERARFKPLETLYNDAISTIRAKMTKYQTDLIRTQREAQEKIASKMASGYIKPETAVSKLEALPEINKEHATEAGLVQFRSTQTLKVTDITKIAKEYFDLNEQRLLKALKDGTLVEGAEIEIIQTPVNYR